MDIPLNFSKNHNILKKHLSIISFKTSALNTFCRNKIGEIEKKEGIEFSLMTWTDGTHHCHAPPIQDFKRAYQHNRGPNTGSMGCIYEGHNLSFLTNEQLEEAQKINERVLEVLQETCLDRRIDSKSLRELNRYKGCLYGSFMLTHDNELILIEYNARPGDPEGIPLIFQCETPLLTMSLAILSIA